MKTKYFPIYFLSFVVGFFIAPYIVQSLAPVPAVVDKIETTKLKIEVPNTVANSQERVKEIAAKYNLQISLAVRETKNKSIISFIVTGKNSDILDFVSEIYDLSLPTDEETDQKIQG